MLGRFRRECGRGSGRRNDSPAVREVAPPPDGAQDGVGERQQEGHGGGPHGQAVRPTERAQAVLHPHTPAAHPRFAPVHKEGGAVPGNLPISQ